MDKLILATGAALCVLSGTAFAADLVIEEPAITAPAADTGIYLQLLAGGSLPGTIYYFDPDDGSDDGDDELPAGGAVAAVIGIGTGLEGLSVEGDFFLTQRDYVDGNYTLTTGTAMAALKYTVSINDSFALYGAIGLGGVYQHDEASGGGTVYVDGWGLGYLLKAGVTAKVAEQISLVGEVRYANSFDPIGAESTYDDEQAGAAAVLVGVQIGF